MSFALHKKIMPRNKNSQHLRTGAKKRTVGVYKLSEKKTGLPHPRLAVHVKKIRKLDQL